MEDSKHQKFIQVLNTKFEDLATKEDLAIMDLATKANLAIMSLATKADLSNGRLKFIRWMFLLTIAQVLIIKIAVHFLMK